MQAFLQGAKELDSLTCAAHYAQLAVILQLPGDAGPELASDYFARPYNQWLADTADKVVSQDPWPLITYPVGKPDSEVCRQSDVGFIHYWRLNAISSDGSQT